MCTHGHTRMQRARAHAEPCACQTRPYVEILSVVISRSGIMGGSNFLHFAFPYFITLLSLPEDSDMIHTSFSFFFSGRAPLFDLTDRKGLVGLQSLTFLFFTHAAPGLPRTRTVSRGALYFHFLKFLLDARCRLMSAAAAQRRGQTFTWTLQSDPCWSGPAWPAAWLSPWH